MFSTASAAPFWVDLSRVDLSVFGVPKAVDLARPLLWTVQTDALWQELSVAPSGYTFRSQILAGPSGIGKSHIALLLALRCYAVGYPLLYVQDAGELVAECMRSVSPLWAAIDTKLLCKFAALNADVVPAASDHRILYDPSMESCDTSLMRLLHDCHSVIILDEHGHAYNAIMSALPPLNPRVVFPLLIPESYVGKYRTRCVFAGSNQARFEGELNGSFTQFLRFVTPFTEADAVLFLQRMPCSVLETTPTTAWYQRWANLVPGEMEKLAAAISAAAYVSNRRQEMRSRLGAMVSDISARDGSGFLMAGVKQALADFFHLSSAAMGAESSSFLELGYVYRCVRHGTIRAAPLCYPATLALLDLWSGLSGPPNARLASACQRGDLFEDLVWDVLLTRGFSSSGVVLDCRELGADAPIETITLRLNEYYVSSLEYPSTPKLHALVNAEIATLLARCKALSLVILYRCPVGCRDVDFFVLYSNGTATAIQTSISSLTAHGSSSLIRGIPKQFCMMPPKAIPSTQKAAPEAVRLTRAATTALAMSSESCHAYNNGGASFNASVAALSLAHGGSDADSNDDTEDLADVVCSGAGSSLAVAATLVRYLFVTVTPADHPILASSSTLKHVRIVSAVDFI